MLPELLTIRLRRVVVLAALLLAAACAPSGPVITAEPSGPVIKLAPPASQVQVGDTFSVPINIDGIANLTAIEMHLSFDANLLEVVSVKDGGFLQADFPVQNTFDNTAGTIDYAVAQINRPPANGSGTLLEIVFRAKATGEAGISFRETQAAPAGALLADPNGAALQVLLMNAKIIVK